MQKIINMIEKSCFSISFISILIIMFITTFDLLARKLINYSIPSLYELTEDYLMVSLVFLSMSYVFTIGGHVRVTLLEKRFPPSLKIILEKFLSFLALVLFLMITIKGWGVFVRAYTFQEISNSVLGYPLAPAFFLVPLGAGMMCVRIFQAIFMGIPKSDHEKLEGD